MRLGRVRLIPKAEATFLRNWLQVGVGVDLTHSTSVGCRHLSASIHLLLFRVTLYLDIREPTTTLDRWTL